MVQGGTLRNGLLAGAMLVLINSAAYAELPTTREYPTLYKSPRAMGMGGAYTAVGGRADSLFYNPAGLINIPQDKGWEFNLINLSVEYNKNTETFMNDVSDAYDVSDQSVQQLRAINDVLTKYDGQDVHVRAADFTSLAKSYDSWAFAVGGVGSARLDAVPHSVLSADGYLDTNAEVTYGGIGGFSMGLVENLYGGVTVKYLHRESVVHNFTALELVENQDNLGDLIQNDLRQTGNAVGLDAGLIWKFAADSALKPSLGASVMNIGDLDFGKAGKIPQTVNAGISINPSISMFRSLIVAADYIDVLNNFKEDKDVARRLRYGAELQLFDVWPAEMSLRAGMYEGSPTLGADLRLLIFTVSYVMYTEDIGIEGGQDKDRRQLLTLNIGW